MNLNEMIDKELTELFETGKISSEKALNDYFAKPNGKEVLNFQVPPNYNFLNLDKPTVFCHLNPGGYPSINEFKEKLKQFATAKEFIESYKHGKELAPQIRFKQNVGFDNFDYKQALFLSGFPDNGLKFESITDTIVADKNKRSIDCYNVLTQKTQLELLPFESKSFKDIFTSLKSSEDAFPHIKPFFMELLNIIIKHPRKYIIFGSNQYDNLIKVANQNIDEFSILKKSQKYPLDIGTKNKAYTTILKLKWKQQDFYSVIAHSFPRQDLPNAFDKMRVYGQLSYEKLKEFSKE